MAFPFSTISCECMHVQRLLSSIAVECLAACIAFLPQGKILVGTQNSEVLEIEEKNSEVQVRGGAERCYVGRKRENKVVMS